MLATLFNSTTTSTPKNHEQLCLPYPTKSFSDSVSPYYNTAGMDEKKPLVVKLMLVGDSGVGKTSLLMRWSEGGFNPKFMSTIGIDFRQKYLKIDNRNLKVQVWDTAGQERFRVIAKAYYRGSMGLLMVFDVTDRRSFDNVSGWIKSVQDTVMFLDKKLQIVLVGNKVDLKEKRVVTEQEAKDLAAKFGAQYLETSAKSDEGVSQIFDALLKEVVKEFFPSVITVTPKGITYTPVVLKDEHQSTTTNCCMY
eukprot:TRINITY_DN1738_c0_g2_i1.p2 TRINITY_DN1738_c0_g2~~TRINITY_DN1738_c0_g2_i1.p2  ORF type:complete len:251 (-),score=62.28 TRINITY_DN1738_c0_g2_i1:921-1673(-)